MVVYFVFLKLSPLFVTDILIEVYGVSRGFDGLLRSLRCSTLQLSIPLPFVKIQQIQPVA